MKLISAIALLGTAHHVFAEEYTPSGRFELKHGNPEMKITSTLPTLAGEVYFTSSDDTRFSYTVEYYDMAEAGDKPTTCLDGSYLESDYSPTSKEVDEDSLSDHTSGFNLAASVWNGDTATICARMKSTKTSSEEEIDAIETLAKITRTFTGDFSINVATKSKNAAGFTSSDNNNEINVTPFLCNDSDERIYQSVQFAPGQDFKICVEYDSDNAAVGDDNAYNIDALKNVTCSWKNLDAKIINDADESCMYADSDGIVFSGADCSDEKVFSIAPDESGRFVRAGNDDCLEKDDGRLWFRPCSDEKNQKFSYNAETKRLVYTIDDDNVLCASYAVNSDDGTISTLLVMDACSDSSATFATFTVRRTESSDTLVDETGTADDLTILSTAGGSIMSFTGVVKNAYVANGNTQLTCKGNVTLSVAPSETPQIEPQIESQIEPRLPPRKLETINNVRFSTRARALQPRAAQPHAVQIRDLQEAETETEFSVGINLDPTASSSASASNGMTSMVLMAAAGVLVALI